MFFLQTTPGELKFALKVESKLNSLPDPEYRQLVVEVLMVLGLAAKSSSLTSFGDFPIAVEHIINQARDLFLRDQVLHHKCVACIYMYIIIMLFC